MDDVFSIAPAAEAATFCAVDEKTNISTKLRHSAVPLVVIRTRTGLGDSGVSEAEGVPVELTVEIGVPERVALADGVTDGEGVPDNVFVGDVPYDADADDEPVEDGVVVGVPVFVGVVVDDVVGVCEALGLTGEFAMPRKQA